MKRLGNEFSMTRSHGRHEKQLCHELQYPQVNLNQKPITLQLANLTFTFAIVDRLLRCFCPAARAVSPPPDGGYPNDNTAEGDVMRSSTFTDAGIGMPTNTGHRR